MELGGPRQAKARLPTSLRVPRLFPSRPSSLPFLRSPASGCQPRCQRPTSAHGIYKNASEGPGVAIWNQPASRPQQSA